MPLSVCNLSVMCHFESVCMQTGPKGVIKDWREFKRLETEKRTEQEKERQALAKKLTLTCRSHVSIDNEAF